MRFSPTQEQESFAEAIDDVADALGGVEIAQAAARGDRGPAREVWRQLGEMGVVGLRVPEADGGIGGSAGDLVMVFERIGYHGLPGPWAESVAVLPHLVDASARAALAGGAVGTVAVEPFAPFAVGAADAELRYLVRDGRLSSAQPVAPDAELGSVSPTRRLARLEPAGEGLALAEDDLAAAVDEGALATAALLVGAAERMLEEAVSYALVREQFGRPIGEFQAIKHALADVRVAVSFARPLVWGAAVRVDESEPADGGGRPDTGRAEQDGRARAVSAAKVAAGEAARTAARTALQVHGAIGYTQEHHLGLWITEAEALRAAWGTADHHRARIAEVLRREGGIR